MFKMHEKNKSIAFQVPKVLYENRYCNQEDFSILVCGGKDKNGKITNEVSELKIPNLKLKKIQSMVKPHSYLDLLVIKSNILAIGHRIELDKSLHDSVLFVEIYSEKTKTWNNQYKKNDETSLFCDVAFMSKLYLIGGWADSCKKSLSSCNSYDLNSNTWNKIANLNIARDSASCTVFEGKIVITGGMNNWTKICRGKRLL